MGKYTVNLGNLTCVECGNAIDIYLTPILPHGFCSKECESKVYKSSMKRLSGVRSVEEFGKLYKEFLVGNFYCSLDHAGPLYGETEPYVSYLASMYDNGFYTYGSQPGHIEANRWTSQEFGLSFIEGVCTREALSKLKTCDMDYMLLHNDKFIYDCMDGDLVLSSVKCIHVRVIGRDHPSREKNHWQDEISLLDYFEKKTMFEHCPHIQEEIENKFTESVMIFSKNYGYHTIFRDVLNALM
jgi:hypothetical protein